MTFKPIAFAVLFVVTIVCGETTVVVDHGRFASAVEAATAEERVNWHDADLSDDNACTESFAAVELQHYFRKMTGRESDFVIASRAPQQGDVIRVGGANDPELGPEGYRIQSRIVDGRRVTLLSGGSRVGTLYAAYDLLHRLGCRWFAPGELHEEVPRITGIPDMDVTEKPSFVTRGFLAWENRGDPDFLLWMARNRLNYWTVAQQERGLMRKLGIRMVYGSHDALELFLNPSKYFEAHPEWFALVKGKRTPGIKGKFGTNYCTSNADATSEFVKNYVQALVDGECREADIVRFWFLDAGKWCECDNCKAQGTPTDRNLFVTHRFAEEVKKARQAGRIHRPIMITFLAYADVVEPPSKPLPQGFDYETCAATFYPIRRCYVHNFDDTSCEPNHKYFRQLDGWARDPQRHYRGQIAIGEYYNVSRFKCLPICFMRTMANDIPCYYKAGARHFDYMHVTCRNWGNKALTNYQMARQLWNVETDCETLWQDYFAKRYSPAAKTMRAFYESLENMLSNATELKYGLARRLERGDTNLFPNAHLPSLAGILDHGKQCRQLLTEATSAPLPPRIKQRIAEDERNFTYGERTVLYYDACVQAFTEARAKRIDVARKHYAEAQRLAELLRADTLSTRDSSSHGNAENALVASGAAGALAHIAKLLAPENDIIPGFLSQVSENNLRRGVFHIAKDPLPFRKANYTVPGHKRSSLDETDDWIETQLRTSGYKVEREQCKVQAFSCDLKKKRHHTYAPPLPDSPFYKVNNLYAKKTGKRCPKEIILLVAHKDSQSWIDSPGAYDNAVGTVANLEIARVLANYESNRSIWFLWCNEEHKPWTSITAASNCWQRGDNLVAIFNTDSIGGKSEEDIAAGRKTNVTLYTGPEAKRLADLMAEVNDAYKIGLVQRSHHQERPSDDHGSFVKTGYPCAIANLGSYPYVDPNYHEAGDTPQRVDIVNVRMAAQAILAAVLRLDRAP